MTRKSTHDSAAGLSATKPATKHKRQPTQKRLHSLDDVLSERIWFDIDNILNGNNNKPESDFWRNSVGIRTTKLAKWD